MLMLCPFQSWMNPAEMVISTLNLALKNVFMREEMLDGMKRVIMYIHEYLCCYSKRS